MFEKKPKNETTLSQYFADEEVKSLKILIIGYTVFILCAIAGFIAGKIVGMRLMKDWQFGVMVAGNLLSSLYAVFSIYKKKYIFLVKYILFLVMAAIITLGMLWMNYSWIFLGYYLLVVMAGFFHEWKICLFSGSVSLIFFLILNSFTRQFSMVEGVIWMVYFVPAIAAITLINKRNYVFIKDTFKRQQEMEEARMILEIKVAARTKELRGLAESLDEEVKGRTKELQVQLAELERFNKLAVGRELRMIELKEEIKKIKEELKLCQSSIKKKLKS